VKRTGGDEPTGIVMYRYRETTQGNSLSSYLYLKLAKTCFSFYLLWFFFYKIQEQEGRKVLFGGREVGTGGTGEVVKKGVGGQIQCKYCIHMYENIKMRPAETIPGM
jgi:hypothetical protein